eukprot:80835-Chlamydomonas_euryale.AAC.1
MGDAKAWFHPAETCAPKALAPHAMYSQANITQLGTQLAMSMMQAMAPMLQPRNPPKPTMRPYGGGGGPPAKRFNDAR